MHNLQEEYEKLKISEEIYRVAMGLTDHIISVVDIPNRTTIQVHNEGFWSTLTTRMENAPESIIETGIIHPDDVEEFRRYYRDMYDGMPETGCTIRSHDDNRGWLWFRVYSKTVFDDDGNPLRAICFSDDITSKKNAEFHYKQYKSVITADSEFVWEANLTLDKMISEDIYFNELFNQHSEQSYSEIHKIGITYLTDDNQRYDLHSLLSREALLHAFSKAKREVSCDYEADFNDGKGKRWMHCTAYLMTNINGEIIAIICANDITKLHRNIELLEIKAEHDELTGLSNRAGLSRQVEKALADLPDNHHGFLMFDIDFFKNCNDTYGHAYGDDILCVVADTMRETFRSTDVLCRLGGDEFVVFLSSVSDSSVVTEKGNALIKALNKTSKDKNLKFPIKVSVGATMSHPKETFKEIYVRMDEALYASKRNGRNQLTFS